MVAETLPTAVRSRVLAHLASKMPAAAAAAAAAAVSSGTTTAGGTTGGGSRPSGLAGVHRSSSLLLQQLQKGPSFDSPLGGTGATQTARASLEASLVPSRHSGPLLEVASTSSPDPSVTSHARPGSPSAQRRLSVGSDADSQGQQGAPEDFLVDLWRQSRLRQARRGPPLTY